MESYEIRSERVGEGIWRITTIEKGETLFEALWKTDGVTYNAYLVETSEGWVLVEGAPEGATEPFLEEISRITDLKDIRYVILDHLEPDHSGALKELLKRLPDVTVFLSSTGSKLFDIPRSRGVSNGESISIGERSFTFFHVPWVHWPETMFTLVEDVLFTGDILGSFGIHSNPQEDGYFYDLVKYTASVLMEYKPFLLKALQKIEELSPRIVAPAHGPIIKGKEIGEVINRLKEVIENPKGLVVLASSMYGRSWKLAEEISKNEDAKLINILDEAVSDVLSWMLTARKITVVFPTYDGDVFPPMKYVLELAAKKHLLEGKEVLLVNTYLWGPVGEKAKEIVEKGKPAKVEIRNVKSSLI